MIEFIKLHCFLQKAKDFERGLHLFDMAISHGLQPSVHNFSPLLKTCGSAARARDLLQRMEFTSIEPNVISYTAAIKACELTGDWRGALDFLQLMRANDIPPNDISYTCVLGVLAQARKYRVLGDNTSDNRERLHAGEVRILL
jgi:pentatricopeptide repeat protein